MIEKLRAQIHNPFVLMSLVVALLALKAAVKMFIGSSVNSTMLVGDGVHNIADMVENIVVIIVLIISTRPRSQEYSMGRGNAEFFATFGVSLLLMGVALDFIKRSLGGLAQSFSWLGNAFQTVGDVVHQVPGVGPWLVDFLRVTDLEKPEVAGPMFPYLVAVVVGSIVISRVLCHYQIKVGKQTGHAIVQAAGEEMKVDSRIEIVTLVGIVSQKVFPGAPWLEYAFALVVAYVVAQTGKEMFMESIRALSARSIGATIDERLTQMCLCIPGVSNVVTLGTFRVGPLAVVKVTLNTMIEHAIPVLTDAVECQLKHYVIAQGFVDCQVDVMFKKPTPNRHRVAYAVNCSEDGQIEAIAATVETASHIIVADMEFGEIDRATLHAVPVDIVQFLTSKRVRALYVFDAETQQRSWTATEVVLEPAVSYLPTAVGLSQVS